ncbi:transporter substrate-binding domain-containing protein [Paracoccus sediminilitoris]|uniref:transporter substrate-binding domain-containing protein n=1 Tax=Paracoccus sediminilitoris TaxID=2202419 RepID=UPI000DBA9AD7|nr:transporter substrate-binding domain-containing protein [Paracoccus sediminilitoris]
MLSKFTLAAVAALGLAGPVMAETLKVGVSAEPYPPFFTPDASGSWSGWEIDLMNEICTRIEAECVVTPIAWDGIIPALTTGKIDMIMGSMTITPARAEQIAFSDKYYAAPTGLMTQKGSDIEPTAEGVSGAFVGAQSGSIQEVYANKYYADTAGSIRIYQNLDEELQDLAAGRLDAVIGDTLAMQPFAESEAGQACCEYKGAVEPDPEVLGYGAGAGLRQEDTELLARVNKALAEIREDGTYDQITQKYFTVDIYGD